MYTFSLAFVTTILLAAAASEEQSCTNSVRRDEFEERLGQLEERLAHEVASRQKLEAYLTEMASKLLDHQHLKQEVVKIQAELDQMKEDNKDLRQIVNRQRKLTRKILQVNGEHSESPMDDTDSHQDVGIRSKEDGGNPSSNSGRTTPHVQKRHSQRQDRLLLGSTDGIAFTAVLLADLEHLGIAQTIKFDSIISNLGNGYDLRTGAFTTRISGWYVIELTAKFWANAEMELQVVKDGHILAKCWRKDSVGGSVDNDSVTQMTVVHLDAGNEVWVQTHDTKLLDQRVAGTSNSRFSGFLLYRD